MSGRTHVSTTNACKLCTPLGAALAFRGVEGAVPFLHGSQGCATYMRRYVISHYREPMDIASSALGEKHAIHGGGPNLKKGLLNVMKKYHPQLVGVATTCLTETIGDDVTRILREFRTEFGDLDLPDIVHVSTPSFSGTHMEGWHAAVRALTDQLTVASPPNGRTCLLPGLVSPADIRHLRDVLGAFGLDPVILPDISDTLDGPGLEDYAPIPAGGTPLEEIRTLAGARGVVEMGRTLTGKDSAGKALLARHGVPLYRVGIPIGLRETDTFMDALERISRRTMPLELGQERGRLVDAMVDGHKYVSGKTAVVYGDADMVVGLCSFLSEIGIRPVLAATGARGVDLEGRIGTFCGDLLPELPLTREGADFHEIATLASSLLPDILVGNSKGYRYARDWNIPLVRTGFPIHDRFGGQRLLHVGYTGALALFDRIVNAIIERSQTASSVGYGYL